MAAECWKRKFGDPCSASDIFSFGMMLWEMLARERTYTAFPGVADIAGPDGNADVRLVPGRRPAGPGSYTPLTPATDPHD